MRKLWLNNIIVILLLLQCGLAFALPSNAKISFCIASVESCSSNAQVAHDFYLHDSFSHEDCCIDLTLDSLDFSEKRNVFSSDSISAILPQSIFRFHTAKFKNIYVLKIPKNLNSDKISLNDTRLII